LDALKDGLNVLILTDAIAGVNLKPENSSVALEEVVSRGGKKTTFEVVLNVPIGGRFTRSSFGM